MVGLLLLIFISCWLALMANFFVALRTKSKLKKTLKNRHQEIRRNLGVFDSDFNSPELREGAFSIFGLMLSFGSKKKV